MDIFKKAQTTAYLVIFLIIIVIVGFWASKKSIYAADGTEMQIKPSGMKKADAKFTQAS